MSYVNPYYQSAHWKLLRKACIARDHGRCTVQGCNQPGKIVDHIETRPFVPYPCAADCLDNVRLLCGSHDAQIKEQRRGGQRKQGGAFRLKGCDASGRSLDPKHPWNTDSAA